MWAVSHVGMREAHIYLVATARTGAVWDSRGAAAVESLNLEAGRLGKLLLFKLVARGIGYTADLQVVLNFALPPTGPSSRRTKKCRISGTQSETCVLHTAARSICLHD